MTLMDKPLTPEEIEQHRAVEALLEDASWFGGPFAATFEPLDRKTIADAAPLWIGDRVTDGGPLLTDGYTLIVREALPNPTPKWLQGVSERNPMTAEELKENVAAHMRTHPTEIPLTAVAQVRPMLHPNRPPKAVGLRGSGGVWCLVLTKFYRIALDLGADEARVRLRDNPDPFTAPLLVYYRAGRRVAMQLPFADYRTYSQPCPFANL